MKYETAGRRILVADDEKGIADSLAKSLEKRLACESVAVYSGDDAIAQLALSQFDVLITDMMMPGVHGFELLSKIKSDGRRIRIIVMTAYPDDFPYVEAINHGADAFVVKPCRIEELQAQVLRQLREIMHQEETDRARRTLELDVAALKDACSHHQMNVQKYKSVFEHSMLGNAIVDPANFRIIEANRTLCEMTGYDEPELHTIDFSNLFADSEKQRLMSGLAVFAETSRGTLGDISLMTRGGKQLSVDMGIIFVDSTEGRLLLAAMRDVSEHQEFQRRLVDEASRDPLTGLLNKRTFYSRVDLAIAGARRQALPLSLMFIDLDNFKQCNDTKGHQVGDELLKAVGDAIMKTIRTDRDSPFRFGGDEFAVLLAGIGSDVAAKVGDRVRAAFTKNECHGTSMSVGIAELTDAMDVEDFVGAADSALYRAKAMGKNTVAIA